MKKSAVIIFCVLTLTAFGGCYRIRYEMSAPSPRGSLYTEQRWNNYFLFGFVPSTDEYSFQELCHSGELKEVQSYRSPGNILATFLSLGLTAPSTFEVSCLEAK